MFEGVLNLQLPFMLISSGVSSLLYIIFLFYNADHPKTEDISQSVDHQITVDKSSEVDNQTSKTFDYKDYFSDDNTAIAKVLTFDSFSLQLIRICHYKTKHAHSQLFAEASFSRPPPLTV